MVRRFQSYTTAARVFSDGGLDQLAPAANAVALGSKTWYPNGDAGTLSGASVAAPTLTITDNGDGTGAVATIADSTVGSTNVVFASNWPLVSFANSGSRSGDGTVSLTLTNGPHLAYVVSTLGSVTNVSNMVHFRTTDADDPVFKQCLDAVRSLILGLSLTGLDSTNVLVRKLPWNVEHIDEGVYIHPATERYGLGTNLRDDVGYGVMVSMIKSSNRNLTGNMDTFLAWRESISSALRRGTSVLGISEVFNMTVEPGTVYLPEAFAKQYDVGAILVRCHSREPLTV